MKPSVTAMLRFGQVEGHDGINLPVGVSTAVETTKEVSFKNVHSVCHKPLSVITVGGSSGASAVRCESCDSDVPEGERVKGYEVVKGEYVVFTEDEIALAKGGRSPLVNLRKFVSAVEIKPTLISACHYLIPGGIGDDIYGLLYQGLSETNMAGFGSQALWGKEHPCAVIAWNGVLLMISLHLHQDMKEIDFDSPIPREGRREILTLIKKTSGTLDPDDLVSGSRERLTQMIEARLAGRELPPVTETEAKETPDLMAALKTSIELMDATQKKTPRKRVKA